MLRIRTVLVIAACVLAAGCGHTQSNAAAAPPSVVQADRTLATTLTQIGLAVCQRLDTPPNAGQVTASTLILGPCDQGASGTVEISAYPSTSARTADLKELARPSQPWTQGWAWGKLAVVISEKTPPDRVLAVGSALKSLHASLVFEH